MSRNTNEELYVPLKKTRGELSGYEKFAQKHGIPPIKNMLLVAAGTLAAAILLLLILMATGLRLSTTVRDDGVELKYFGWMHRGIPTLGIMQASDGSSANVGGGYVTYSDGSVYRGDMENFVPDGYGTLTYADGTNYNGYFKDGKYSSYVDDTGKKLGGKLVYADGTAYEGDFENGLFHGNGSIVYADGSSYEGSFENGERKYGTMVYYDGGKFEGEFKNDMRYLGVYTWKNNESIQGYFKNNIPDPSVLNYMIYTDADGDMYEVRIIDGVIRYQRSYTPDENEEGDSDSPSSDSAVG